MGQKAALHRPHRGVSVADRQQRRRAALIAAGFDLFGTRGIAATTIEEVCTRAGLNKRYFYESFDSINDLAEAVVDHMLADVMPAQAALISSGGIRDPRSAIAYFVTRVMSDPRIARLLFIEADSGGLTHQRQRFVDMAVTNWVTHDPAMPDNPEELDLVRLGAYAYVGACREVLLAVITGKFCYSSEQVADLLTTLLRRMLQQVGA